ncbi:hypothetical protein GTP46_26750 [Duganella sp. FT135W]|uniref:Uncharacterized protein n=1 Tax=Duganella flavida TaxID=2692175 RepID=A0A6L8KKF7_9BURK|nr:hypothetical protein [Duganella flavida]MYM26234.1 hypothetical protein [Duganella flavida]
MKPITNINASKSKGKGLPIRRHQLLSALLEADIQDVETMEAFFAEHGSSNGPGMSDRQRLCDFLLLLQAAMQGRRLPASSTVRLTQAELRAPSKDERALLASLLYFTSHQAQPTPRAMGKIISIAARTGNYTFRRYSTEESIKDFCTDCPSVYL